MKKSQQLDLQQYYHKILTQIELFHSLVYPNPKAGRKPKISNKQIMTLLILSYFFHSPLLTLTKQLLDPSINSYHIFRKVRIERIYSKPREYMLLRLRLLIVVKMLAGKKLKLIVDGTILSVANVNRART